MFDIQAIRNVVKLSAIEERNFVRLKNEENIPGSKNVIQLLNDVSWVVHGKTSIIGNREYSSITTMRWWLLFKGPKKST